MPVEAWFTSDRPTLRFVGQGLRAVTVDPVEQLPDVDRDNNTLQAQEPNRP